MFVSSKSSIYISIPHLYTGDPRIYLNQSNINYFHYLMVVTKFPEFTNRWQHIKNIHLREIAVNDNRRKIKLKTENFVKFRENGY